MAYAISCGHELTAEAAELILKAGGNAFDAMVAAFAASWVVEPCMSGPGGGGFATVLTNGNVRTLDFFTQTPAQKRPADQLDFRPVTVNFGGTTEVFHFGYGSVAVPGAVDGLFQLHSLGARMPMKELVSPAVRYASEGHVLVPFQRYDMELLQDIIQSAETGRKLFFSNGQLLNTGDEVRLPEMADFLEHVAVEGRDAFYKGEISARVAEDCLENGGHLKRSDLEEYRVIIGKGTRFRFRGLDVAVPGGASVGSKLLHSICNLTTGYRSTGLPPVLEGMMGTHRKRHLWYDPHWNIKEGGTSHISVIDGKGDAVSLSMSLGEGSGYFIEGTDIQMNNMLGEAALLPDGWHSWIPDTRLQSMMTPVVAFDPAHKTVLATGSGGASRIPFALAQALDNYKRFDRDIHRAVEAPRVHWNGTIWQAEPGYIRPKAVSEGLWNQWQHKNLYFGGVHMSEVHDRRYAAIGDDRRDGVAIVSS